MRDVGHAMDLVRDIVRRRNAAAIAKLKDDQAKARKRSKPTAATSSSRAAGPKAVPPVNNAKPIVSPGPDLASTGAAPAASKPSRPRPPARRPPQDVPLPMPDAISDPGVPVSSAGDR